MQRITRMKPITVAFLSVVVAGLVSTPIFADEAKPAAEKPNPFATLDQPALEAKMTELIGSFTDLERRARLARKKAMTQDKALVALNQELLKIQQQIRTTLAEKYPDLATLGAQKAAAIESYHAAQAALAALKSGAATRQVEGETTDGP